MLFETQPQQHQFVVLFLSIAVLASVEMIDFHSTVINTKTLLVRRNVIYNQEKYFCVHLNTLKCFHFQETHLGHKYPNFLQKSCVDNSFVILRHSRVLTQLSFHQMS